MAQTNTAVVGGNVTGNIGSCEVKSTSISTDSWHTQTIAVDSCTGQVIYKSEVYYNYGYIYFPLVIAFLIVVGAISLKTIES